ncbi:MAG: hypothetical protein RL338_91 [Chloroflexota bacterium]|jgi:4-diphosphocytidyl-2-C-methyl-D-erythritol kinase
MSDPLRRLAPVVRLAPAKVNLTLAVVGRRPDGYHALHSVFVPLELADRLSLAPAPGGRDTLHVAGPDGAPAPDVGPPDRNLVIRAIARTREAVGLGWAAALPAGPAPALAARLEKRIPVAAGLAGGSSDAAAAIAGALEMWGAELPLEDRLRIGAAVGSDVPFFLAADPPAAALVEGRGEVVTPLRGIVGGPPAGVLLVTPRIAVGTPEVFAAYAAGTRPAGAASRTTSEHLAAELARGLAPRALVDRAGVLAAANDLLPATLALFPALVPFRRALMRLLGRPVGQSGSGPTCVVLYPSLDEAVAAGATVLEAVGSGRLPPTGEGAPAVVATTIGAGGPAEAGPVEEEGR